ncbi:hypothetical protein ACJRO7_030633 [Eucalyptus globulus]|uniref:Uncharacterized protein n=1 Tax=Eucalyptus globulus TaxID=34317 RepID=A0ABD3JIF0_EUCGL
MSIRPSPKRENRGGSQNPMGSTAALVSEYEYLKSKGRSGPTGRPGSPLTHQSRSLPPSLTNKAFFNGIVDPLSQLPWSSPLAPPGETLFPFAKGGGGPQSDRP